MSIKKTTFLEGAAVVCMSFLRHVMCIKMLREASDRRHIGCVRTKRKCRCREKYTSFQEAKGKRCGYFYLAPNCSS